MRATRNVAKLNMFRNGTWAQISCRTCKVHRKASKWKCPCGICWHQCKEHRKHGFLCRAPEKQQNLTAKVATSMGLKSKMLKTFLRKREPNNDRSGESLGRQNTTGTSDEQLRLRLREKYPTGKHLPCCNTDPFAKEKKTELNTKPAQACWEARVTSSLGSRHF